ncbi:MAG: butyrate kinase [Defluviitaleaceae bacterium]|nr:butyrate kinase [Defluviitaleaceae bacterium]
MHLKLLIVNPGSTSTKVAIFEDTSLIMDKTIRHSAADLAPYAKVTDQYDMRKEIIMTQIEESGIPMTQLDAVVGMGGLLKPIPGGTYRVNEAMLKDLRSGVQGLHASNLGGLIAHEIAKEIDKPSFIVDPVVVDEFDDISRISGHPMIKRRSIFHALNQKAIARQYCSDAGKGYFHVNLVVVHMGGGISVGVHAKGRVIDATNALDGEGPFSPERSGGLPVGDLVDLCYSGKFTQGEMRASLTGKGGMVGYFGSNNMMEVEERAKTDPEVGRVIDAMAYQISKEIAALSTAVNGKIDAILLTGGLAHWDYLVKQIAKRVKFIAEVNAYPGEHELLALALGALRVLKGEEPAKIYE